MRILFFTRMYQPNVGGVEKHISEISKRLIKKEHNVTIVTTKYDKSLSSRELIDNVNVIRFSQPKLKYLGLIYTWFWLLFNVNLISNNDIVHCHDVFIWYLPFRILFPNKLVFTTFHGWEGKYPPPVTSIVDKIVSSKLSWKNICVGKFIEKYFAVKADVISHGATYIPNNIQKKVDKSIVYIGRLEKDTGLPILLKVLKKLKDYKVEFCGDGSLKNECRKYGKVNGFVDPNPYLSKAEICFPSGYLSILEGMAHKCLIVTAYDNKLKKDYFKLTPFSNWIVSERNPSKIVQSIKRGVDIGKIDKAYDWVKKESWDNLTNRYIRLWGLK